MKREFESIENDYNSTKEKLEAAKLRNKVLGNENKTLKDQVKTLLEKGKHDDELVDALMVCIDLDKKYLIKKKQFIFSTLKKKQNQLKNVLEGLNYQNEKVSKEVEDKSKEVNNEKFSNFVYLKS